MREILIFQKFLRIIVVASAIYDMNKERCIAVFESETYSKYGDADITTN